MRTEAFACKRAVFAFLRSRAAAGLPLAGVQVSYAWPGRAPRLECVYGGGVRFTRVSAGDDGHSELWLETALVGLYVRVTAKGRQVADTDARAEQIGEVIESLFAEQRRLPGNYDYAGIASGTGDYAADDDGPTTTLAYQASFQYYLD